ncbi:ATP-binding protein [Stutzerimonas nitrititolerans]|uniref:ATP-binding protein n=1 Tax=Stutzerimonas nitrititolerans TaxID=2482751 RepID=A0AA41WG24_9GAMM|nr:ATP-binding protein [Stutzerimonas nitrititolerans]MCO7544672.1 ATP-binding protein [Stutzerimonas nitrititolerans]
MTIFVAGVHGVGKSYLCQKYVQDHDVLHESASSLIRKERSHVDWSVDKKVADVDDNQVALNSAVKRILAAGHSLLLDGHFVLIDRQCNFTRIPSSVFNDLCITGVILIEADPDVISNRLKNRDATPSAVNIADFINAEREQAQKVCREIGAPLKILASPDYPSFSKAISDALKTAN